MSVPNKWINDRASLAFSTFLFLKIFLFRKKKRCHVQQTERHGHLDQHVHNLTLTALAQLFCYSFSFLISQNLSGRWMKQVTLTIPLTETCTALILPESRMLLAAVTSYAIAPFSLVHVSKSAVSYLPLSCPAPNIIIFTTHNSCLNRQTWIF